MACRAAPRATSDTCAPPRASTPASHPPIAPAPITSTRMVKSCLLAWRSTACLDGWREVTVCGIGGAPQMPLERFRPELRVTLGRRDLGILFGDEVVGQGEARQRRQPP